MEKERLMNHEHRHDPDGGNGMKSRTKWVFIGFAIIAGYFLIAEHKAHLSEYLGYWPLLLVLACPLLHGFMHGGRGHGGHHKDADRSSQKQSKRQEP
jgi:hypothetical protein